MSLIYDFIALLQRRALIIVATFVVGALAIVALLLVTHPTYQASAQVMSVGDSTGARAPIGYDDLPSVATSTIVLGRVIDKLGLSMPLSVLQASVKARTANGSQIMSITYQNSQPERAVAIPNAVADELTRYYEEVSTRQSDSEIAKLTAALETQKQQLQAIGRRLVLTQTGMMGTGDDKGLSDTSARIDDLSVQRGLAVATLTGDRAFAQAATPSRDVLERVGNSEKLQSDPFYKELSASTAKDRTELAVDHGAYKSDYPGFPGLQAKVVAEQRSLEAQRHQVLASRDAFSPTSESIDAQARKASATVVSDQARVDALDSLIASERKRFSDAPAAALANGYLQLQRDAARANYLALSGRLSAAVSNRSLALGTVVVLDRAVRADTIVVGLTRSRLVLMLSALVLVIAIGLAYLAETMDPRLSGANPIEGVYGVPLLATLKSE